MEVEQEVISQCPKKVKLPLKTCFYDKGAIIPPHVDSIRLTSKNRSDLSKETMSNEVLYCKMFKHPLFMATCIYIFIIDYEVVLYTTLIYFFY